VGIYRCAVGADAIYIGCHLYRVGGVPAAVVASAQLPALVSKSPRQALTSPAVSRSACLAGSSAWYSSSIPASWRVRRPLFVLCGQSWSICGASAGAS